MTGMERLRAAVARLEALKADSTGGGWDIAETDTYGRLVWGVGVDYDPSDPTGQTAMQTQEIVAQQIGRAVDAELIVTLHRTIDAQIAILNGGIKNEAVRRSSLLWSGLLSDVALALADAVLGGAE